MRAATAINDKGQVVGISGACGVAVGDVSAAHAVIWENEVPTRIPDFWRTCVEHSDCDQQRRCGRWFFSTGVSVPGSPYLLIAGDVNAGGEIAGFTGDGFGSLATPDRSNTAGKSNAAQPVYWELPANVRRFLRRCGIED